MSAQVEKDPKHIPDDGSSPRPWLRIQHDKHDFSLLGFGGEIAHVECEEADFEFIYKAVNSHDALLEALRALLLAGEHEGRCDNEGMEWDEACSLHLAANEKRREQARVAVRLAEGGELD